MANKSASCVHSLIRRVSEGGYTGPVNSRDENRAAHGNIAVTDECTTCGARRSRLINGRHEELGEWGLTRAAREVEARRLEADARRQIASVLPVTLTRRGEKNLTLYLDSSAYIVSDGGKTDTADAAQSVPEWLAAAQRARRAVLAACHARAELR